MTDIEAVKMSDEEMKYAVALAHEHLAGIEEIRPMISRELHEPMHSDTWIPSDLRASLHL